MTEWNAPEYARIASLQEAMAAQALSLLDLKGTERVLDLGCGNGKITAQIAARVPQGSVVGVDASAEMTAFASSHYGLGVCPNLCFETCDIRRLTFHEEFDLVISFNALHWIPDQAVALRAIRSVMKSNALAQLRLVPRGPRKSIENVLKETRQSKRWSAYFQRFHDPYLHLTPAEYATLAEENGFKVRSVHTEDQSWDFKSRASFEAFCSVTCIEWTKNLPESERPAFITDVLDRYRLVAAERPGEEDLFKFYQMDIQLSPGFSAT
jgi:trans-aconitate 2-methyltransferase